MLYRSTRTDSTMYTGSQAILKGLAADGGLFVPSEIPTIDYKRLIDADYCTLGAEIVSLFLPEFSKDSMVAFFRKAYGKDKFSDHIVNLPKTGENEYTLELWHGPTAAFKDFALVLMPYLMQEAKRINNIKSKTVILVATSGDTGKAALEGYKDIEGIDIIVYYPYKGTSEIQRLQMDTQEGNNVKAFSFNGNFDDVQTAVKKAFLSSELNTYLEQQNIMLSSANSINWGRLIPQIVYYFYAYILLVKQNSITIDTLVDFCVPSGNFGDIMAGYYAKAMGLPINTLICASNKNNILTDFINTGIYNIEREFHKTLSPSMDILISSNLERLLYDTSNDPAYVNECFRSLSAVKQFTATDMLLKKVQETFFAGSADDIDVINMISKKYELSNYLCDPHTATAYCVLEQYKAKTNARHPCIVLSTANPYKFSTSVLSAFTTSAFEDEFHAVSMLENLTSTTAPKSISSLQNKPVRFSTVVDAETIIQTIKDI